MPMKNPPHPGSVVLCECIEPAGKPMPFALRAEGRWPHRRRSGGQRPDLWPLSVRFDPQVVLELSLREEVGGERQSLSEPDAEVHRNRDAAIEDARNGGTRHAVMFGELGCGSRAEELLQQFPWAGRVVHHGHGHCGCTRSETQSKSRMSWIEMD